MGEKLKLLDPSRRFKLWELERWARAKSGSKEHKKFLEFSGHIASVIKGIHSDMLYRDVYSSASRWVEGQSYQTLQKHVRYRTNYLYGRPLTEKGTGRTIGYYNPNTKEIFVESELNPIAYETTARHETLHKKQYRLGDPTTDRLREKEAHEKDIRFQIKALKILIKYAPCDILKQQVGKLKEFEFLEKYRKELETTLYGAGIGYGGIWSRVKWREVEKNITWLSKPKGSYYNTLLKYKLDTEKWMTRY